MNYNLPNNALTLAQHTKEADKADKQQLSKA
jgi:hypothetical protein